MESVLRDNTMGVKASMRSIKEVTSKHPNLHAAGKALGIHPQQLKRWIDNDAHINDKGEVYIKTKGRIKSEKNTRMVS